MKIGDIVVCVNDTHWPSWAKETFNLLPKKGMRYTIRRIIPNIYERGGPDGLALEGIYGEWDIIKTFDGKKVFEENHFRKDRFRLVEDDLVEELEEALEEVI